MHVMLAIMHFATSIMPEKMSTHHLQKQACCSLPTWQYSAMLVSHVQIFSDAPNTARWIVPIHHAVVHNMVATATQADKAQRQAGHAAPGKLSAAATYLQSSIFSDTLRKGD